MEILTILLYIFVFIKEFFSHSGWQSCSTIGNCHLFTKQKPKKSTYLQRTKSKFYGPRKQPKSNHLTKRDRPLLAGIENQLEPRGKHACFKSSYKCYFYLLALKTVTYKTQENNDIRLVRHANRKKNKNKIIALSISHTNNCIRRRSALYEA